MIRKFNISRDDSIYHAWPDLAFAGGERLVCVFSECTHHGDRSYTRIMFITSEDRGRTWTAKRPLTQPLQKQKPGDPHWNCARITALEDGRLAVAVDQISGDEETARSLTNWLFYSHDRGETWDGPHATPVTGIVPDKLRALKHGPHAGRWLLSAHTKQTAGDREHWAQRLWFSDDKGDSWHGPVVIAESFDLKLCEGCILELPQGELVCFLRENSFIGRDGYKAISHDGGLTWEGPFALPIPGLHRPVAGLLQSGNVLVTHRYLPGGRGGWGWWAQNTFATFTNVEGCLATERNAVATRVMPIDYDRNAQADTGYTGWVQFDDGEIYVVNYILDDAPKGQIRGYSFHESDIILP